MTTNIILTDQYKCAIYTDTLACHEKEDFDLELRPWAFVSKTFILPKFKAIFTGNLRLAWGAYRYISEWRSIGGDLDAIKEIKFGGMMNQFIGADGLFLAGSLFFCGYSDTIKAFTWFAVIFSDDGDIEIDEAGGPDIWTSSPFIDNWREFCGDSETFDEIAVKTMIEQKRLDESVSFKDQIGIGGDIQVTEIHLQDDGKVVYVVRTVHEFYDKDIHYLKMPLN